MGFILGQYTDIWNVSLHLFIHPAYANGKGSGCVVGWGGSFDVLERGHVVKTVVKPADLVRSTCDFP